MSPKIAKSPSDKPEIPPIHRVWAHGNIVSYPGDDLPATHEIQATFGHGGVSGAFYLTAEQARAMAGALLSAADDCDRHRIAPQAEAHAS